MSTTADILGSNRNASSFRRWSKQYAELCAERDRLMARDFSTQESSAVKLDDISDAAADESERGLSLVTARATHSGIIDVLEAIRRIESGTYGICELTGKPIEPERLNAIPWARYTLEGQRELEEAGLVQRHALPSLEIVNEPTVVEDEGDGEGEKLAE